MYTIISKKLLSLPFSRFKTHHLNSEFKIQYVNIVGAITFPIYYMMWTYIFPQPYESFALRAIGTLLTLAMSFSTFWPNSFKKYYLYFAYGSYTFCLPFFFTANFLMNGGNSVWLASTMAAFVFSVLIFDSLNLFISTIIGVSAAILFFLLSPNVVTFSSDFLALVPVLLFALSGVIFLHYSDDLIAKKKLAAAEALAGQIAHEVSTPLCGAGMAVEKMGKRKDLSDQEKRFLSLMKRNIQNANSIIETMLKNLRPTNSEEFTDTLDAGEVVRACLSDYHYRSDDDEAKVSVHIKDNFFFQSNHAIFQHVISNLLKNAFRAITSKPDGHINIEIGKKREGDDVGVICIRDNGTGISPDLIGDIFVPFVTSDQHAGTGIGLSYVKSVIEQMGGQIRVESTVGEFTSFEITLPTVLPSEVAASLAA